MSEQQVLETLRLRLRPWKNTDREPFAAMNSDPAVMEFFPSVLTRKQSDEFADRIIERFADHGFGPWAVEERDSGAFVGVIGLSEPRFKAHFTPCVEIVWRLRRSAWGKGYATEGARQVLEYGLGDLGLTEIVSFTAAINERSIRVMRRIGMTHDAGGDFDHPNVDTGHVLQRHVLYRVTGSTWAKR